MVLYSPSSSFSLSAPFALCALLLILFAIGVRVCVFPFETISSTQLTMSAFDTHYTFFPLHLCAFIITLLL